MNHLTTTVSAASLAFPADDPLYITLTCLSGLFWTLAYLLIIWRGCKDKSCGMPLVALSLNLSWELLFVFGAGAACMSPHQRGFNGIWLLLDIIILFLQCRYGRDYFKKTVPFASDKAFYPCIVLILILSFLCVRLSILEWNDPRGMYSAYLMNFIMSALFIVMLLRRGDAEGQSMGIAIFKCLGTLAPSLMGAFIMIREYGFTWSEFVDIRFMPLMKLLMEACFVLDILYIVLLYRTMKYRLHLNPWSRRPQ